MVKRLTILLGAGLLMVAFGAPTAAQPGMAWLRVIHAAPMTNGVDVFLDGTRVFNNFQLRSVSSYEGVAAGEHKLLITPVDAGVKGAINTVKLRLTAGQAYTVAVVGLGNVTAQIYTDDLSAPPAGKARVRVIHASPDAPSADVNVVNGPTLVQNLAFPDASPYLEVAAGRYNLQVVAVGDNSVFLRLPNTEVQAGQVYDVVAIGRLADIKVTVATYRPTAGATQPGERAMIPMTGISDGMQVTLLCGALLALGLGMLLRRQRMRG